MLVFKFGGASVKNADAVKNVGKILEKYPACSAAKQASNWLNQHNSD